MARRKNRSFYYTKAGSFPVVFTARTRKVSPRAMPCRLQSTLEVYKNTDDAEEMRK
jgi:hypothetical protein